MFIEKHLYPIPDAANLNLQLIMEHVEKKTIYILCYSNQFMKKICKKKSAMGKEILKSTWDKTSNLH